MYLSEFLPQPLADAVDIIGFNTDSRAIKPGEIFVAIKGENFDGNEFIEAAVAKGASAVIASTDFSCDVPVIKVDDVLAFVQDMARHLRSKMTLPIVAVTGSSGKTTTKNLLANILHCYKNTLATVGNFNSLLGMPLTMLNLRPEHEYGVFEIGMSEPREIAELTRMLRPNIGIITNIGRAHLVGVGDDLTAIAKEKSELFANLVDDKVAIINCDDHYFGYMHDIAKENAWYGFTLNEKLWHKYNAKGNVWLARDIKRVAGGYNFNAVTTDCSLNINLNMLGKHNIANALAAIAAAKYLQVPDENIIAGIAATAAAAGRLSIYENSFGRVIDDSYNANPESCKAAITVLSGCSGKKILVLGDMMELGKDEIECHREIGIFAKQSGIDYLLCYGKLSHYSADAFGDGATAYNCQQDLWQDLKIIIDGSWSVLVKGSASLKMSNIAKKLIGLVT